MIIQPYQNFYNIYTTADRVEPSIVFEKFWQFNEVYMGEKLYEDLQEKTNNIYDTRKYEHIRAKIVRQKSTKNG